MLLLTWRRVYSRGVRRNGGRVGGCHGPAALRSFLQSMGTLVNPEFDIDLRYEVSAIIAMIIISALAGRPVEFELA